MTVPDLINDYERRLATAEKMLKNGDYGSYAQAERIKTKAGCFRHFIFELKKVDVLHGDTADHESLRLQYIAAIQALNERIGELTLSKPTT